MGFARALARVEVVAEALHVLRKAARMPSSECKWISLSALDTAVLFYEKFGFDDMTVDDITNPDHFQTWMEMKSLSVVS